MASSVQVTFNDFANQGAEEGLKAAIVQTMIRIRAEAVQLSPVDQGQLANSIMWRKGWGSDTFGFAAEGGFNEAGTGERADRKIDDTDGIEGVVGTAVLHGTYQEFGTRYMPAQPYLRPAADSVRGVDASAIATKWGRDAMREEFKKRKARRL